MLDTSYYLAKDFLFNYLVNTLNCYLYSAILLFFVLFNKCPLALVFITFEMSYAGIKSAFHPRDTRSTTMY